MHYYVLEMRGASPIEHAAPEFRFEADDYRIGVEEFEVESPYDRGSIVYRVGAATPEVGFYRYHRWATPLGDMLPRAVADGLGALAKGYSIEPAIRSRTYDAYLEGRLVALEEIDLPGAQTVRLRMDLRLTSSRGEELWSARLSRQGSTETDDVAVIVEEMTRMLRDLLSAAHADVQSAVDANR